MVEKAKADPAPITPRRQIPSYSVEGRVFERGNNDATLNAFQRKLVAARDKTASIQTTRRAEVQPSADLESILQWRKHYRKIFPTYSFYFESIPEDLRTRFARQVTALGAVCV